VTASETRAGVRPGTGAEARQHAPEQDRAIFRSILYGDAHPPVGTRPVEDPDFFVDLNLDQVVDGLTAEREPYDLRGYYCTAAHSVDLVRYRQDVLADLDDDAFADRIRAFAEGMRSMREKLRVAGRLRSSHQRAAWVLDAIATYCAAVRGLARDLSDARLRSAGWRDLRAYLSAHVRSPEFTATDTHARELQDRLTRIVYCIRIRGGTVGISGFEGQPDYAAEITAAFAKFRQGDVEKRTFRMARFVEMNHVEAQILDRVALLFPDVFRDLHEFVDRRQRFVDETVALFDREVQFYLAYLELIAPLRRAGLPFCRPEVFLGDGELHARDTFDLALATKLVPEGARVVRNDLDLSGDERIIVVTGPNQGGKTTFARTFGQLHHLAALGLLVPGTSARLPLADRVFTQFERGENMADLSGKLADDLTRIHAVLGAATERSVVVVNEIFTSTTLDDARFLGEKVLRELLGRGCVAVYVTFVDELASLAPQVVSMVSTVDPDNPAVRTLKVVRRPADGLAYADVLARKYGLTPERIAERVTR
jgi:DNA mismatch repair protein MutS